MSSGEKKRKKGYVAFHLGLARAKKKEGGEELCLSPSAAKRELLRTLPRKKKKRG